MQDRSLDKLILEMTEMYDGDPARIQHFLKVHAFAGLIAREERLSNEEQFVTETAAIVHDIGIRLCEQKYGSCGGKLQEKEGPALAEALLDRLGFAPEVIERVSYLVGHHHTYDAIDGMDYQILVEADFLVNLFEQSAGATEIKNACAQIFRTKTGTALCRTMFGLKEEE